MSFSRLILPPIRSTTSPGAAIHGPAKRARVIASLIMEIGSSQQRMAHRLGKSASPPRLTADVALSTLDQRLTTAGATDGVTRDEKTQHFSG